MRRVGLYVLPYSSSAVLTLIWPIEETFTPVLVSFYSN